MEALGIERYSVVGHSMGGYVALAMLDRYSDRLESITLLSSFATADSEEKCDRRRREIELVKAGKKSTMARLVPHAGFAPQNTKRLKDWIDDLEELIEITEDEGLSGEVYYAGAKRDGDKILSAGGRVLGVTATAKTLSKAIDKAYKKSSKIHFANAYKRNDIGTRALKAYGEIK
jgi:phosphoribosylamine-glycine ligase